jgi:putative aldouronate transport system substrate-binding protein
VDKEEDGTYTVLAPPEGESADTFAWVNSFRDFGPKYISEGFNDKVTLNEESGDGLKLKLDAEINQYATEQYPSVVYTSEELGRLSTLNVDIGSYVSSMQAKWIVEGGVEEEWDTYMSTLEKMGYDEFMEIQQTALERYQSNLVNN